MSFDKVEHDAVVTASRGNGMFEVLMDDGVIAVCTISGKIRKNNIRILPGDKVQIEVTLYDMNSPKRKGRIIYRKK